MADKLIFIHAGCNRKLVNDAICGSCGKEIPLEELNVMDVAMASSRSGGIRPAAPSEVEYYSRIREYPGVSSAAEVAAQAKKHEDYRTSFEDSISRAVAKALVAAGVTAKAKGGGK